MPDESFVDRQALRAARDAGRSIRAEGEDWRVYELPPPQFDRRRGPSLVFEGHETVRVVRNFPNDWRKLSDEELLALSWAI